MPHYLTLIGSKGQVILDTKLSKSTVHVVATAFDAPGTTAGLLLPAVQKVREAASRSGSAAFPGPGSFASGGPDPATIALLLPAVQKVREAARSSMKLEIPNASNAKHWGDPHAHITQKVSPARTSQKVTPSSSSYKVQPGASASQKVNPPATAGWGFQILPYIEQDNLFKAGVKEYRPGKIALWDHAFELPSRNWEGELVTAKLHDTNGGFRAILENALVFPDRAAAGQPSGLVVIAFSSSRPD